MQACEPLDPSPQPASQAPAWGRGMFVGASVGLAAVIAFFAFTAEVRDPVHLPLGLLILFFAGLPGLLWARRGKASLPTFEIMLLTTGNVYALPLLNGHDELYSYHPSDITTAALAVLVFQAVALAVYKAVGARPSKHPFWRDEAVSDRIGNVLMYGMGLNTTYVILSLFTTLVPSSLEGILRAVFFGIGIVSTFIASRKLGAGELSAGERLFFVLNLLVQCVGMLTTLFLVGTVSLLLLALVGYVSGSGRIPLVAAGLALFGLAVLHNGKSAMRAEYWQEERLRPAPAQMLQFFAQWGRFGIQFEADEEGKTGVTKLIDRTSLFHMMCLVVSASPHQQPFMAGETYADIPAQFVPRILWPEKPPGHVSTSRLSVYYGLQTEEETEKTTIGFGMLTEAYANFGFYGVAALGAFLGFLLKKVQGWGSESPLFSYGGIVLVLLLAWSFQTEFTLSIWLASLYQACIASLFCPFVLRRMLG